MFKLPFAVSISHDKLSKYINILGVVLVAWFAAGIVSQAMASLFHPKAGGSAKNADARLQNRTKQELFDRRKRRGEYDIIVNRNIFDSENRVAKKKDEPKEKSGKAAAEPEFIDGPPVKSTLPVKLLGTMVVSNPLLSLATIAPSGRGKAEQYGVGDMLMGEAKVTSIERNKVFLLRNRRKEYLETENASSKSVIAPAANLQASRPGGGVRETSPGKYIVDQRRIQEVMANMSQVMTQARVVPHFENGKPAGWKIFAIKPKSIYQELKLKNGDIIQRINGTPIDSPAKALEMYQQLASETNISIDLQRRGVKRTFDYEIR